MLSRWAANCDAEAAGDLIKREHYYLFYGLVLSGLVALIFFVESVDPDLKNTLIKEGGLVESLSAIGYFICLLALFLLKGTEHRGLGYVMFVMLIFGLRELDFDKRFTTWNVSRIELFPSPSIPIIERIIGAVILLPFFYSIFMLVKCHFRELLSAARRMEPYAIGVCFGILLLCVSQILDGLKHKFAVIGITAEGDVDQLVRGMEEILELGVPLMFLIAIAARFHKL